MNRLAFPTLLILLSLNTLALAHGPREDKPRWAVVLAAFGSTRAEGMAGVEKVKARVEAVLPGTPVRVGLTSHTAMAELKAQSVLTAMSQLADEGYRNILIQPLHISAGSEYADLRALADALDKLAASGANKPPFAKVVLGEAALGRSRSGDPQALAETARALAGDAREARQAGAALVYAAHGNPRWPSEEVKGFQAAMAGAHPGVTVLAGTIESSPNLSDVLAGLKKSGARKVILYPLLFGAGVHVAQDLCGREKDSWTTALEKAGYEVDCRQRGLGEVDAFADMLAGRAKQALESAR